MFVRLRIIKVNKISKQNIKVPYVLLESANQEIFLTSRLLLAISSDTGKIKLVTITSIR